MTWQPSDYRKTYDRSVRDWEICYCCGKRVPHDAPRLISRADVTVCEDCCRANDLEIDFI